MKSGTNFEQGEILLVPFPFTNLTNIKQRPALVLSTDDYNLKKEDIIICGMTSQLKETDCSITVTNADLEEGNLPKTSLIKVDKLFQIEKSQIRKSLGKVNKRTFQQVREEFYKLI